jgi:hypothetical protein
MKRICSIVVRNLLSLVFPEGWRGERKREGEKQMNKPQSTIMQIIALAISMASAADIPKNCTEEIINISKRNGFDMQKFMGDLLPAVTKAKLQAKAPFGKPKDSDKMDIGMTFGCLKAFPESQSEITSLLKGIGLETAKSMAANKFGTASDFGASGVSANNAIASSKPALKECDAIFNPSKKFCYDGEIYDLCDGMSYNPTTHICSGDIAKRALCNGAQYNPLKQKCENNTLLTVCGATTYNPVTHGCKDNAVFALSRCKEATYDPATQVCKDNVVLSKCGETFYNPTTHGCKDKVVLVKCGATLYDPATRVCQNNAVYAKCGTALYDPITQVCMGNVLFAKCGATIYDPSTQICQNNAVLAK